MIEGATMDVRIQLGRLARWMAPVLLAAAVLGSGHAAAQPTGIDPRATELLKRSTSYLASLKRFSVDTSSMLEAVLTSGQRIAFEHSATLTV
jgi:hypothetical protein